MSDYIERKAALHAINEFFHDPKVDIALNAVPSADVRPVVRGRWEWHGPCRDSNGKFWATCSACRERQRLGDFQRFCPSCGADMRSENDE